MVRDASAIVLASGENGLGAVRSLARARIPTRVVALSDEEPALDSRYPFDSLVAPADELLSRLQALPSCPAVLIPTSDYFVHFLAEHRHRLPDEWRVAAPRNELLANFRDKACEAGLIGGTGVPMPQTAERIPDSAAELVEELGLPIILKPRTVEDKKRYGLKTLLANTVEELEAIYSKFGSDRHGFLAQECIPGPDRALWVCDCVFDGSSELITAFTFRKLSTAPPHHGVTSLGISERNDELVRIVAALGKQLGYVGPADIDFKFDDRDGLYKYLEINPRVGMCNYFATRCGRNCVVEAYRVAAGLDPLPQAREQSEGVVYLDLHDDVHSRRRDGSSLFRILKTYAGLIGFKRVGPYHSWHDPKPGLRVALRRAGQWMRAKRSRPRNAEPRPPVPSHPPAHVPVGIGGRA